MMSTSLIIMFLSGVKLIGVVSTAVFMALVAIWAWRFPGSVEEHQRRLDSGEKVGWLK